MSERDGAGAPRGAENSGGTTGSPEGTRPRGRPFSPGQSGNPGGRPKTPHHLRASCREGIWEFLSELRGRDKRTLSFDELIKAITVMAAHGGLVPAEKAWEFAMQALASQHVSDTQRASLLAMLSGRDEQDPGPPPALRTMPESHDVGRAESERDFRIEKTDRGSRGATKMNTSKESGETK